MIRDIVLGALLASAVTTESGRKVVASAGKIGLKMTENALKSNYNIDLKSLLNDEIQEEETHEKE